MVLEVIFLILLQGVPGAITQLVELVGWASPGGGDPLAGCWFTLVQNSLDVGSSNGVGCQ